MPTGIEWCDETLNSQGWGCYGPGGAPERPQRCWYCYVERQAKGPYVPDCELCRALIPHWHPERLELPFRWKKPRRIFWQSMGDLFHPCTPARQIADVWTVANLTPRHTHIFCTKNPERFQEFNHWPENCILLTTITGLGREEGQIIDLLKADCQVRGLSLEPLLGPVEFNQDWLRCPGGEPGCCERHKRIDWLIIGAYTGKGASRFVPAAAWVQSLIDQGRAAGVPVFLKDNLKWPEKIQEWPA